MEKEPGSKFDKDGNEITREGVLKQFGGEKKHKKLRFVKWIREFFKSINER